MVLLGNGRLVAFILLVAFFGDLSPPGVHSLMLCLEPGSPCGHGMLNRPCCSVPETIGKILYYCKTHFNGYRTISNCTKSEWYIPK